MNSKELNRGYLSIWVYFPIATSFVISTFGTASLLTCWNKRNCRLPLSLPPSLPFAKDNDISV
jgi:hypothetical protein